ncbi:uncharacterized protein FA14DRAFT_123773 [Meira miltonrushii]|uniref:Uncharacterized protein n=1 Tax=Meira miltonrushii TaxID=1280837 RepID=A0A316V7V6_9BASI|nr:uncharacterized protein FA14DRAFT_123773 [Meira miltonrushii]PWN33542.1 hypothetical protein FA14DRAFT_123773 [Meira miltonrushii]
MTLAEQTPTSLAAADKQRHSRMNPGGSSGPNKDGASRPDGASALGNEMGGEADARRERQTALSEGDQFPSTTRPQEPGYGATGTGIGQLNGAEKGYGQGPSDAERQENQQGKNDAWQSGQRDLGAIARNSAGTANHNPQANQDSITSTGNRRPEEILDTAARSMGTESGTGAYAGGVVNQAGTDNVPDA